jgi:hypothetical protein
MVLKKWQNFMDRLEEQRIKKEGGKGTIWISYDEFGKVAEYFEGGLVSPGGAADMLGVSRAMIHQLERDGKIRAYRIIVDEKGWEHEPWHVKLLMSKKGQYIWVPIVDLIKYAEETGKDNRPSIQNHKRFLEDKNGENKSNKQKKESVKKVGR